MLVLLWGSFCETESAIQRMSLQENNALPFPRSSSPYEQRTFSQLMALKALEHVLLNLLF